MEEELFKLNPTVQVTNPNSTVTHSLTKREYFAAMAMQGLILRWEFSCERCAELAVKSADYLIAELNKVQAADALIREVNKQPNNDTPNN